MLSCSYYSARYAPTQAFLTVQAVETWYHFHMPDVIFNENPLVVRPKVKKRPSSAIENLLIRLGLVKTPSGARLLLLFFLGIVVISIMVVLHLNQSPGSSYGNYDEFIKQHPDLVF